ncbi:MAG: PQQ-like beta-propeller repeat protein [Fimbriimonadaceae bacterium]|nr:PQQ-like beta-propeller repeat protein [Fimbriimonadaceae bacterium]QYK59087.1 MAG: PQQ-like beta-propeller repeat protein [Fimbriimonadaceae bacterium]
MRRTIVPFLLLPVFASAQSFDWPVAVGGNPSRSGRSIFDGPSARNLLWTGGLGAVVSQQGAAEGPRFVVARMFNISDVLQGTSILSYDVDTGQELWRTSLPVDFPSTDWRNKVTAVRNGVVYATRAGNTNASFLYALRATDGTVLWKSQDTIDETSTESISFAENGDIIAGSFTNVRRIRASDGTTAWTFSRAAPSSDGSNVAVFGDRGYTWEATSNGPRVVALNLTTGLAAHRSPAISGGLVQQLGLMVGPDGTVYAPRTQNNPVTDFFVALTDAGSSFVEKWRYPMGYTPFASHAVGPDGSPYTYARTTPPTLVKLDPATGSVLATSPSLPSDFFQPRIAVDFGGRVYLTNGAFSNGALFAFDSNLNLQWQEAVTNVNVGGPVLAKDGTLIVCGTGNNIRAYRDPGAPTLPLSFSIFRGVRQSGGLASLLRSEDDKLIVRNGIVANPSEPPIAVTLESVAQSANPAALSLTLEASVSTTGLTQEVLFWNWTRSQFDLVDARAASLIDQTVTATAASPGPYLQAVTRAIRAQIQFRRTGPVATSTYSGSIDRSVWASQ